MPQKPDDNRKALDTGLALTLLALLSSHLLPGKGSVLVATILLLISMTVPGIFAPLARGWFALGEVMAKLVSTLLLTLIFLLAITPTGIIRRLMGKDPLHLGEWRSGSNTLLHQRNHRWQPDDLERPY